MTARRVVTGQTADGKSVLVSDQQVSPITVSALPGAEFYRLWGSDDVVRLPTPGEAPSAPHYFPPVSGFRFVLVKLGPDPKAMPERVDMRTAVAEMRQKLPGLAEVMEPDNPGMHATNTVDFALVVSGEIWLELDDGAQVHLSTGDSVIQNGTRHAWRNKSSQPCVLAFAAVGAERATG
jgi:Cupin domain